jgi:small-conductance mechanosensitive channel
MMWRWRHFVAAVLVAALLLMTRGVPPLAVVAGIAGAALFMWRRGSRLS